MKHPFIAAALLLALAACDKQVEVKKLPYLFTLTEQKETFLEKDIAFVKGVYATADLRLLQSGKAQAYLVPMPDATDITILARRTDKHEKSMDWYGEVKGQKGSTVFITYTANALHGLMQIGKDTYRIALVGKDVYQIALMDTEKMVDCGEKEEDPITYPDQPSENEADGCPDPASDIDIMVLYTQQAEDGAGGVDGIEALIYQSMALTNFCYEQSDVAQRVHLVHMAKVDYTEAGDAFVDRERLRNPTDIHLDGIHALRDAHGADIVTLIVETSSGTNCGFGFIMNTVSNAHEAFGFATIRRSCAVDNKSFPHELGHVMGCRHDVAADPTATPFPFVHGFTMPTPADGGAAWRTIMSRAAGVRQSFFSNPDQEFSPTGSATDTDPRGTVADEDNHRTLNTTAATVANFRCSSPNNGDVWMKDAWQDTGAEPDPATVGLSMSRSPYIWVRNAQDPTFLEQHNHNDPEFGVTNWVYVKLHNGNAAVQNGTLELHIADASVSLTWQAGWTLVASIPANLAGSSTTILEHEWTNVPLPTASSHYCMIARWVSATDPMHTVEGSNIGINVRENNNIVWRNLNVVDLDADGDSEVAMGIAGDGRKNSRIVWWDATRWPLGKLTASGKVVITLDDRLLDLCKMTGCNTTGAKLEGNKLVMTTARATMDGLVLPKDYKGTIRIRFEPGANTAPGTYDFRVQHWVGTGKEAELLGSVDYELVKK